MTIFPDRAGEGVDRAFRLPLQGVHDQAHDLFVVSSEQDLAVEREDGLVQPPLLRGKFDQHCLRFADGEASDVAAPGAVHDVGQGVEFFQIPDTADPPLVIQAVTRQPAQYILEARVGAQDLPSPRCAAGVFDAPGGVRIQSSPAAGPARSILDAGGQIPVRLEDFAEDLPVLEQFGPQQMQQSIGCPWLTWTGVADSISTASDVRHSRSIS